MRWPRRTVALGPYALGGFRFRVTVPPEAAAPLQAALSDLHTVAGAGVVARVRVTRRGPDRYGVRLESHEESAGQPADEVPYCVMQMLDAAVAAHWSATGVVMHAAVVERGGVALALVGYSGVGKSTLAAAALRGGLRYVSDELALVDPDGLVHQYHRPLGMRSGPLDAVVGAHHPRDQQVRLVPASRFGELGGTSRLGMVVLIEQGAIGTDAWVRAVTPASAMSQLLNNLPGTEGYEEAIFGRLHRLVTDVPTVSLSRGPLDSMVGRLHECLAEVVST